MNATPDVNATYDVDAERAALHAVMLSETQRARLGELLTTDDFYLPAHQVLWDAVYAVAGNRPAVDPIILTEHLRQTGTLAIVGGVTAVIDVWQHGAATVANGAWYAEIMQRRANGRRMVEASALLGQAGQTVMTPEDEAAIVERARGFLERIVDTTAATETQVGRLLGGFLDDLERGPDASAVTTGLTELDRALDGMVGGQVIVVGARPGVGKTLLGQQIVQHVARDLGRTAVLYTMEMSARQMMQRVVAAECGVDAKLLRRSAGVLPEADWAAIAQGMDALEAMPLHIVEAGGLTPSRLARSATAFKRAHPDLGVIVIDYIGLMESDGSTMNRQEAIAGISRAIKQLAQRLDVPIVVLSQLNRKSADRADSMPALTDLRDSGAVEQDADVVMLLHRDPQAALGHGVDRHSEMTILVPKCREGDSGAEVTIGVMLAINRMVDYQALPARQLRAVA